MANDFRCDYCGQFIAYDDIGGDNPKAECYMLTPDSEFTTETYATHHTDCKNAGKMISWKDGGIKSVTFEGKKYE